MGGLRKTGERLSHCLGGPENVSQTSPIKKLAKNISEETMVSNFYFIRTAVGQKRTCCLKAIIYWFYTGIYSKKMCLSQVNV